MNKRIVRLAVVLWLSGFLSLACPAQDDASEKVIPRAHRWTSSRVKGSPDPPLPYRSVPVFGKVKLDRPTNITWLPSANKWVANHAGGKIVAFGNDPLNAVAEPLLDLETLCGESVRVGYATKFHHDLENQPWCFLTYTTKRKTDDGHRFARLKVLDPTVPTFDPDSFEVIFKWKSYGHMGSSMQFGPDGMLYVSIGDSQEPYPPDSDNTGQDVSDLRASILRINVDDPPNDSPYRIPPDNPLVGQDHARAEVWAWGLRNPWKIAFDPTTGDLLTADIGWEMREMIYRIKPGRNFGWSIMEGSQRVKEDLQPETPITPPLFEHTHLDSRSITGGHFWQSDRIGELKGAYIYGDWMTGKVWALRHKGDKVIWQKELVDTPYRVICFMLDPAGEVLIVGYDGTILKLEPNVISQQQDPFPVRLSDTGLFADTQKQQPASGVIEYSINARAWADGTQARQWIGLPDATQLRVFKRSDWKSDETKGRFEFPQDTVVAKTISYLEDPADPKTEKRIETQLLHKYSDDWRAYNYIWNEDQTDALLQDDIAIERKLTIRDSDAKNGFRTQTWRHASRSECLLCHIWAAGTVQGFWPEQLNRQTGGTIPGQSGNQLDRLSELGIFQHRLTHPEPLVSPHDSSASLESRARSYLALNCSTCHRRRGGGTADFNFELANSLKDNNYLDALPAQGTFEIRDARVVAPGDPCRSVLLYRTLKSGRGHMPQFGTSLVDQRGTRLLHDWIASMKPDEANELAMTRKRLAELKGDPAAQIEDMLATVEGAMALSIACADDSLEEEIRSAIIEQGSKHPKGLVRDLFEHFLPEDERVERLGATIDEAALLAREGSVEHGKKLFETAADVNCRNCHQVGAVGQKIGPDLSGIGTRATPSELLRSIVDPSEKIDPKYRSRRIMTVDGRFVTGIVTTENDSSVTIADAQGKLQTIATEDIEDMGAASKSAMPEQLLAGMTPQHAADLLSFLSAQRKIGPLQHKRTKIHRTNAEMVIDGRRSEKAWDSAQTVGEFVFTWWKEGDPPRQPTDAKMLWNEDYLFVSFVCKDQDIQAARRGRDSPVYRDDCVEVFASPEFDRPQNYFNLEINALGELLDQYRPGGVLLEDWNADGVQIAVSIDGTLNDGDDTDSAWSVEIAIPFSLFAKVLPKGRPDVGDRWRLNLNRLEQGMSVKSQWSRGDRNFARFHHPEYFGFVEFTD